MRAPDLSLAVRHIFRRPAFAAVAISLLALGAGANAAVFSVVRGVLLRPLPYPNPDRLVAIWPDQFVSNQELGYWRDRTHSFIEITGQSPGWMMGLVAEGGEPIKVTGAKTVDNLFRTLGATAALGRTIEPGDGTKGNDHVVVLSDELWRRRFGADPSILGRTIQLDQQSHAIIGVMPAGFEVFEGGTDLWVPVLWDPGAPTFKGTFSQALARLVPGVSVDTASRDLQSLVPAMRTEFTHDETWGQTLRAQSLQDTITGDVRPALLILLGAVGLILLLAAVNLGTLVLGRSIERVSEMAVRTALGASRARLIKQIMTEQAVLAALGGIAGIGVARLALPALVSRIPAEMPRIGQIALDWSVLATVLAASIAVAVAVALIPAVLTARPGLQPLLRQSRSTDTPTRRRALAALVSMQIALAVVLGIGAMLMLRSLWNLQQVNPGFNPNGVLTFRLQTTSKYRGLATGLPYVRQMMLRVGAMPGVTSVGAIAHLPLSNYAWTIGARRADQALPAGAEPQKVGWRFIDGEYFAAMNIPVLYGRAFRDSDENKSAAVAILNETLARQYFGDASQAVGRTVVQYGGTTPGEHPAEVVGVVGDVRHAGLDKPLGPELYRPLAQTFMFPMAVVARASVPSGQLAGAVRQAAFEIDPVVPVAELQPYTTLIAGTLGRPRLLSFLLTIFAGAGLLLGLVGVYGVVGYRVRQREREIGIRLALGAEPSRMAHGVFAQGLGHAAVGLAFGLPAAFLLSRVMSSVVFGVTPRDPLTYTVLPIGILLITMAACYLPARRASRVDPATAIRADDGSGHEKRTTGFVRFS
jgi:putative ABC transport system permease protein